MWRPEGGFPILWTRVSKASPDQPISNAIGDHCSPGIDTAWRTWQPNPLRCVPLGCPVTEMAQCHKGRISPAISARGSLSSTRQRISELPTGVTTRVHGVAGVLLGRACLSVFRS